MVIKRNAIARVRAEEKEPFFGGGGVYCADDHKRVCLLKSLEVHLELMTQISCFHCSLNRLTSERLSCFDLDSNCFKFFMGKRSVDATQQCQAEELISHKLARRRICGILLPLNAFMELHLQVHQVTVSSWDRIGLPFSRDRPGQLGG